MFKVGDAVDVVVDDLIVTGTQGTVTEVGFLIEVEFKMQGLTMTLGFAPHELKLASAEQPSQEKGGIS